MPPVPSVKNRNRRDSPRSWSRARHEDRTSRVAQSHGVSRRPAPAWTSPPARLGHQGSSHAPAHPSHGSSSTHPQSPPTSSRWIETSGRGPRGRCSPRRNQFPHRATSTCPIRETPTLPSHPAPSASRAARDWKPPSAPRPPSIERLDNWAKDERRPPHRRSWFQARGDSRPSAVGR